MKDLWTSCDECRAYMAEHPLIVAACASVGIEYGKSTRQMMIEYFVQIHARHEKEGNEDEENRTDPRAGGAVRAGR